MRIEDGEVESFPLLRSVATLSGVLGEDGLAKIADRLAETGTRFSVLTGDFHLADGSMRFDPIMLQSADYTLRGEGSVDLVAAALDGRAAMSFSAELSEMMRAEEGRPIAPDTKETALNHVLLYWRLLRDVAENVSDTEVKLSLPNQTSPGGLTYTIQGVVDIVQFTNFGDLLVRRLSAGEVPLDVASLDDWNDEPVAVHDGGTRSS